MVKIVATINKKKGYIPYLKLQKKWRQGSFFENFLNLLLKNCSILKKIKSCLFYSRLKLNSFKILIFIAFCFLFSDAVNAQFCANPTSSDDITVSASIQQTNTYSNGKRAFIFTGVSGYTYVFSTCLTTTGDTKLRLYSSATGGTELAVSDNACGANGKQSEIIWVCPSDGDYSIFLTKKNCKNLNFSAYIDYYFIIPDPCAGVTLTVNAGSDLSLCLGNNTNLSGSSSTTYNQPTYAHCASTGNLDFSTSNTLVSFDAETSFSNVSEKLAAYTDYSSSIFAEVIAGQTYTNALSLNINSDGNWVIAGKAWIDWNNNNVFEASEAYELGTTTNSEDGPTTLSPLSITVPVNASTGFVKMRITSRWEDASTECENNFDGEVEDYSILVTSPVAYSWTPTTNLDNPLIATPLCSAITNTTYTLSATNSDGCMQTDEMEVTIESPTLITSQETIIDNSTCGEISIQVSSDAVSGSGVWSHTNGLGLFDAPSDAITLFTTNTFNQSQNTDVDNKLRRLCWL